MQQNGCLTKQLSRIYREQKTKIRVHLIARSPYIHMIGNIPKVISSNPSPNNSYLAAELRFDEGVEYAWRDPPSP